MIEQTVIIALAHAVDIVEADQDAPLDIDQVATIMGLCDALDIEPGEVLDQAALRLIDPAKLDAAHYRQYQRNVRRDPAGVNVLHAAGVYTTYDRDAEYVAAKLGLILTQSVGRPTCALTGDHITQLTDAGVRVHRREAVNG